MKRRGLVVAVAAAFVLAVVVTVRPDLALTGWVLVPVLVLSAVALAAARRLP